MSEAPRPIVTIETACEVMHDAYEAAAVGAGWETQRQSRVPWTDVPEANKATMRAAVKALIECLHGSANLGPLPSSVPQAERDAWIAWVMQFLIARRYTITAPNGRVVSPPEAEESGWKP